jgi:hypothetical protein
VSDEVRAAVSAVGWAVVLSARASTVLVSRAISGEPATAESLPAADAVLSVVVTTALDSAGGRMRPESDLLARVSALAWCEVSVLVIRSPGLPIPAESPTATVEEEASLAPAALSWPMA